MLRFGWCIRYGMNMIFQTTANNYDFWIFNLFATKDGLLFWFIWNTSDLSSVTCSFCNIYLWYRMFLNGNLNANSNDLKGKCCLEMKIYSHVLERVYNCSNYSSKQRRTHFLFSATAKLVILGPQSIPTVVLFLYLKWGYHMVLILKSMYYSS